jgi:hypothetical protein
MVRRIPVGSEHRFPATTLRWRNASSIRPPAAILFSVASERTHTLRETILMKFKSSFGLVEKPV